MANGWTATNTPFIKKSHSSAILIDPVGMNA